MFPTKYICHNLCPFLLCRSLLAKCCIKIYTVSNKSFHRSIPLTGLRDARPCCVLALLFCTRLICALTLHIVYALTNLNSTAPYYLSARAKDTWEPQDPKRMTLTVTPGIRLSLHQRAARLIDQIYHWETHYIGRDDETDRCSVVEHAYNKDSSQI
jgi:hypothetical protein